MIVTLDGQRLPQDFSPGTSLRALIDLVRSGFPQERLITSVAVNGQVFDERDLTARLAQPVGQNDQVDLESADRRWISAEALRAVAGELAKAGQQQMEVADQLNSGRAAEAVGRIGTLVGSWQTCQSALVQCSELVGEDLTAKHLDERSIAEHLSDLVTQLRELRDALDARDMVLLADLLHYEMPALCDTWHDLLLSLADDLTAGAADV